MSWFKITTREIRPGRMFLRGGHDHVLTQASASGHEQEQIPSAYDFDFARATALKELAKKKAQENSHNAAAKKRMREGDNAFVQPKKKPKEAVQSFPQPKEKPNEADHAFPQPKKKQKEADLKIGRNVFKTVVRVALRHFARMQDHVRCISPPMRETSASISPKNLWLHVSGSCIDVHGMLSAVFSMVCYRIQGAL
jgi:hypothetical protein